MENWLPEMKEQDSILITTQIKLEVIRRCADMQTGKKKTQCTAKDEDNVNHLAGSLKALCSQEIIGHSKIHTR